RGGGRPGRLELGPPDPPGRRAERAGPPLIVSLAEKPTDPRGGPKRAKWKSASQIETFKLCQRKWGFRTIEGIKASNRFAEAGTAYHDLIEPWLLHGTPLPADDI